MAIAVSLSAYAANGGAPLTYSGSTTYVAGDVVTSGGVKYKAKQTTTGNTPATGQNANWAEIVEKTIGSASRDYSTIAAWVSAMPSFADATNKIWKGLLYKEGTGANGEWIESPDFTTKGGGTHLFPWLEPAPGQGFVDNANVRANALSYNPANGVAISGSPGGNITGQVFLRGLQINGRLALSGSGTTFNIVDTIISWSGANVDNFSHLHMINSVLISPNTSGNLIALRPTGTNSLVNCTFIGAGGTSIPVASGYPAKWLIRGCAMFGFSANINSSAAIISGSDYNATNLASMGWTGTGNMTSLTTASQFENSSSPYDLRVKAGSGLTSPGSGARYQSDTNDLDISRFARSTASPTIGAWEYGSSFTAPTLSSPTVIEVTTSTAKPRVTLTI